DDMEGTPAICDVLARCIPWHPIGEHDPIGAIERSHLRHLLVHAGAGNLLWSGLNLAVLHLAVPYAATFLVAPQPTLSDELAEIDTATPTDDMHCDPWAGARGFWYRL